MNRKDIGFSIFGIIFIISALSKAMNMPAFMALTREFMSLVGLGYMLPYSMPVAVAVCSSEITLGIMMFGRFKKIALIGILLMLTGFTWLTWVNLTDMYGGIESCGCFGELIHFSPLGSFVKNIVLITVSLVLLSSEYFFRKTEQESQK